MRASASKDSGALGITATLDALWMGDVQTLIVADALRLSGVECSNCGRLDASSRSRCPACQSLTRETHDLVHRAMARTREQGGRVEVFHDDLGTRLMQNAKGLAALLRFKAPLVETHVGGPRAESWRH